MYPLRSTRLHALAAFTWFERRFDRLFGSRLAEGAYVSIDQLSRQQWYLGGVLRSVHRYAADAFIVVMLLHLLREALLGRYSGFRRFSWLTGVPLVVLAFTSAIGGFWLNWDQLGQFSALATAELLDVLPVFASPLTRNFLDAAAVSDRLFSLFIFVHVGTSLFLVFGLWFHIQRLAHAAIFPPRAMALGVLGGLLGMALIAPVLSHPPADMALAPTTLALDWMLLFIHPLATATSPGAVWVALMSAARGIEPLDRVRVLALLLSLGGIANCTGSGGRRRSGQLQWLPPVFR